MSQKSTLIIGAGLGGIAAAAHLAQRGLHVTVLEKNARPGGRCDRFSREGHHFDTGPTLFIMPHVFEDEFTSLGARCTTCSTCSGWTPPTAWSLTMAAGWRSLRI